MSVSYDRRVVTRDEASFFSTIPHTLHEEQPLLPKVPYSAYIEATTTRRRRLDQEGRRVEEGIISCRPYPSSKARLSHHQKRKQENSNLEHFFFGETQAKRTVSCRVENRHPASHPAFARPHHHHHQQTTSTHRTSNQNHIISSDLSDDTIINWNDPSSLPSYLNQSVQPFAQVLFRNHHHHEFQ